MAAMLALLFAISACLPVEGDRILMGDLAVAIPAFLTLDAEETIGFTPAPGSQRRFSPGELDRLAARKGITVATQPVCFERTLETLTKEQVITALHESLPEGAQMELLDFSRTRIPKGTLEFLRAGLAAAPPKWLRAPVIWTGRVKYTATRSLLVWAKVSVWISRSSAVAVTDLPAGKPILASQVRMESADAGPFSESIPASLEDIVGLAPRRAIRAGQLVSRSILDAATDVTRGEMVAVEAHYGAASLRFEARAESPGRAGDRIQVRNLDSGKTFRARVVRKGLVAVE
jgi:flagella basal body P-ring formation protein FlgA